MTCIIPVFNEATRIGGVLAAVVGHPMIDQLIVVDDGSTDGTTGIVRASKGVELVALAKNQGKTLALREGLLRSRGSLILLLDGDLAGLRRSHLTALLVPVLDGRAEISISLRENAPALWKRIGLDYISGERVLPRDLLLPHLDALKSLPKFGFEVWLNRICIQHRCRIAVVPWHGVASPLKSQKLGLRKGISADAKMMGDIFRTVSPLAAAAQIMRMRRLRIGRR